MTVGTNGIVFDLDSSPIKEVDSIENIDQLSQPDSCINSGFIMSISHNAYHEDVKYLKRTQIFTNEFSNLFFEKQQSRFKDENAEKYAKYRTKFKISGMLYRMFADIDIYEL